MPIDDRSPFSIPLLLGILVTLAGSGAIVYIAGEAASSPTPARTPRPPASATAASPLSLSSPAPATAAPGRTATFPAAPSPTTGPTGVTITLANMNCEAADYRVDGVAVVSDLAEGAATAFQVTPGEHTLQVCTAGTTMCGEIARVKWTAAATVSIARAGYCPTIITVTNEHCRDSDLIVDDQIVVYGLAEGESGTFEVTPGPHLVQACRTGSRLECGAAAVMEWTTSAPYSIGRDPECPKRP